MEGVQGITVDSSRVGNVGTRSGELPAAIAAE
jgi:hypothetical protein